MANIVVKVKDSSYYAKCNEVERADGATTYLWGIPFVADADNGKFVIASIDEADPNVVLFLADDRIVADA
jgi:hypothetical protein